MFPRAVRFLQLEDIDHCLLLLVTGSGACLEPQGDLFNEKWFHVAVWRNDLTKLADQRFVTGVTLLTEYEEAMAYYIQHRDLLAKKGGELHELNLPRPKREDYDEDRPKGVRISPDGIGVTDVGFQANLEAACPLESLEPEIKERVGPLLAIPLLDSAVREAGVILETRLREVVKTQAFGQDLVREYFNLVCSRRGVGSSAFLKVLRGELRTLFKFVRNDFAHSLREISETQCRSLLDRMSQALAKVNEIQRVGCDVAGFRL
jgi:hypothetical protein